MEFLPNLVTLNLQFAVIKEALNTAMVIATASETEDPGLSLASVHGYWG
jgi:hypothetical protein